MTLILQSMVFLIMLATGAMLGLWIDLFRFLNRKGKLPISPILDLLFWAVITCIVFIVLININFLELRFYVFLSLGIGLYVYFQVFSCHILHLYAWAFTIVVKMLKWFWRMLRPLGLPLQVASGLVDRITIGALSLTAGFVVLIGQNMASRQEKPPAS